MKIFLSVTMYYWEIWLKWQKISQHIREASGSNLLQDVHFLIKMFRGFPQSFQVNFSIAPYIKPQPLPCIFIPIHYSLLHNSTLWSELLLMAVYKL
jgi:hypothetical protein